MWQYACKKSKVDIPASFFLGLPTGLPVYPCLFPLSNTPFTGSPRACVIAPQLCTVATHRG